MTMLLSLLTHFNFLSVLPLFVATYDTHSLLLYTLYLIINIFLHSLQMMKNFQIDLLARLSFCMIHQLVEYCCITATKVINLFSFLMNPFFFLESFFWRKLARPTILISLLFVISLLKLFKLDTSDKPRITSSCSIVC